MKGRNAKSAIELFDNGQGVYALWRRGPCGACSENGDVALWRVLSERRRGPLARARGVETGPCGACSFLRGDSSVTRKKHGKRAVELYDNGVHLLVGALRAGDPLVCAWFLSGELTVYQKKNGKKAVELYDNGKVSDLLSQVNMHVLEMPRHTAAAASQRELQVRPL